MNRDYIGNPYLLHMTSTCSIITALYSVLLNREEHPKAEEKHSEVVIITLVTLVAGLASLSAHTDLSVREPVRVRRFKVQRK